MKNKAFFIIAASAGILGYGVNKKKWETEGTRVVSRIRTMANIFTVLATWCNATSSVVSLIEEKPRNETVWSLNSLNSWMVNKES